MQRRLIALSLTVALAGSALAAQAGAQNPAGPRTLVANVPCFGLNATHVGTPAADVIVGTPGADVIVGLGGNDAIYGLRGNDRICAGGGADRVFAGAGNDLVSGDAGSDRMYGQFGNDRLFGRLGADHHHCGAGLDSAKGGPPAFGDTQVACEVIAEIP